MSVIALVIGGAILVLWIAVSSLIGLRDREELTDRAAHADSVAHAKTLEAVIARRQASADSARADSAEAEARRDSIDAAAARRELASLSARAAASRARVDTTGLPAAVLTALHDADRFRIAVTPALARDSIEAAGWRAEAEHRARAYEHLATAYAEQGAALVAREGQIRTLEQLRAPRCGRTCGAVLGASAVIAVRTLPALLRALVGR